jgi:integrase/recombinase XerD
MSKGPSVLEGKKVRLALNLRSLEAASELMDRWEAQGFVGDPEKPTGVPIEEACGKFLVELEARKVSAASRKKYERLFEELEAFAAAKGYTRLDQMGVEQVREFRASWKISELAPQAKKNGRAGEPLGALTALKQLERVRAFFRFCHQNEWIPKNPAAAVKDPRVQPTEAVPFTEEEMDQILEAASRKPNLRALMLLLRWSGMRISDVIGLERTRVQDGRLVVRALKNGKIISVPLPSECLAALEQVQSSSRRYFFWTGVGGLDTAVGNWRDELSKLFRSAGVEHGYPHRFRHTFATHLLAHGTSVDHVAEILGDTARIILRHYSHWVAARQQALDEDVIRSWGTELKPNPKSRLVRVK